MTTGMDRELLLLQFAEGVCILFWQKSDTCCDTRHTLKRFFSCGKKCALARGTWADESAAACECGTVSAGQLLGAVVVALSSAASCTAAWKAVSTRSEGKFSFPSTRRFLASNNPMVFHPFGLGCNCRLYQIIQSVKKNGNLQRQTIN